MGGSQLGFEYKRKADMFLNLITDLDWGTFSWPCLVVLFFLFSCPWRIILGEKKFPQTFAA